MVRKFFKKKVTLEIPLNFAEVEAWTAADSEILKGFLQGSTGRKVFDRLYAGVIESSFLKDDITPEIQGYRKGVLMVLTGLRTLAGLDNGKKADSGIASTQ